jgi:hypothetical protein
MFSPTTLKNSYFLTGAGIPVTPPLLSQYKCRKVPYLDRAIAQHRLEPRNIAHGLAAVANVFAFELLSPCALWWRRFYWFF